MVPGRQRCTLFRTDVSEARVNSRRLGCRRRPTGLFTATMPAECAIRRSRRSPAANVKNLRRAWGLSHRGTRTPVREHAGGRRWRHVSQSGRVVALEPEGGSLIWSYDPNVRTPREHRDVFYWLAARSRRPAYYSIPAMDARTAKIWPSLAAAEAATWCAFTILRTVAGDRPNSSRRSRIGLTAGARPRIRAMHCWKGRWRRLSFRRACSSLSDEQSTGDFQTQRGDL
jgi:hypothetical protein